MKSLFFAVLAFVLSVTGALAQDGYRVRSGDTLSIEVLEDSSLNRNVLVTPDGRITFPFAGAVQASGRTLAEISSAISFAIAGNFASPPNVFVGVNSLREVEEVRGGGAVAPAAPPMITVYFIGEVGTPGAREVMPGTTFLQGLSQSGGLTNFAAERRIQLRRTDPHTGAESVVTINYAAIQRGGRLSQNVVLAEGDVILVPQRGLFE